MNDQMKELESPQDNKSIFKIGIIRLIESTKDRLDTSLGDIDLDSFTEAILNGKDFDINNDVVDPVNIISQALETMSPKEIGQTAIKWEIDDDGEVSHPFEGDQGFEEAKTWNAIYHALYASEPDGHLPTNILAVKLNPSDQDLEIALVVKDSQFYVMGFFEQKGTVQVPNWLTYKQQPPTTT